MKKSKHDKIIQNLEARMKESKFYDLIVSNVYFPAGHNYKQGECDLLAIKKYSDGRQALLLFEVKSNTKYEKKAREQLLKDVKCFYTSEFSKVYTFRVYGNKKGGGYNVERIKLPEQCRRETGWWLKWKKRK